MPDKPDEQLLQELTSERERLAGAIDDLRAEVDELKRKLPYAAAVVIGAGITIGLVRKRLSRKNRRRG